MSTFVSPDDFVCAAQAKLQARYIANILVTAGKSWAFQQRAKREARQRSNVQLEVSEGEEVELFRQGDEEMYTEASHLLH